MTARKKKKPTFSAAGVPRPRQAAPTRHEQAILARVARGFLLVTQRPDQPPLFTYEDGTTIRNAGRGPLDAKDFKRLVQWLDPEPSGALFGATPQRWNARRP